MDSIVFVARLALAGVFGFAALAKAGDRRETREAAIALGVPNRMARPLPWLVPTLEFAVAVTLLSAFARWAAVAAAVMLVAFTALIVANLRRGNRPACRCFGSHSDAPIGARTLVRNSVLLVLALVAALPTDAGSIAHWLTQRSAPQLVVGLAILTLALGSAFLVWILIGLLQQQGRLLVRIEELEARVLGPRHAVESIPAAGVPIGQPAPAFAAVDEAGEAVSLESLTAAAAPRPLLLVFTSAGCGACDALSADIENWSSEFSNLFTLVVLMQSVDPRGVSTSPPTHRGSRTLRIDETVSESFGVRGTPTGLVIFADGTVATSRAEGPAAVRHLVEELQELLVEPSEIRAIEGSSAIGSGELPNIVFSTLDGGETSLHDREQSARLLVFWNTACGFCASMLEDLQMWEARAPGGTLLVVTSGEDKTIDNLGFRSPVLLDSERALASAVGVRGTPSAVIVDRGVVASEVAVGREAVLALAEECLAAVQSESRRVSV